MSCASEEYSSINAGRLSKVSFARPFQPGFHSLVAVSWLPKNLAILLVSKLIAWMTEAWSDSALYKVCK